MTTSNNDETDVPFETTDGGYYAVSCPFGADGYPEELRVTYDGVTYTFTDFKTVASQSKVRPDVILFERCIVQ